jgi:microcystin-dependent protein
MKRDDELEGGGSDDALFGGAEMRTSYQASVPTHDHSSAANNSNFAAAA